MHSIGHIHRLVGHKLSVPKLFPSIHIQSPSSPSKSVTLGSKLSAIASLAEEGVVPGVVVGAVQHLVAHAALEAARVPLVTTS